MLPHLRANLWLLVLTLLICSIAYPAALLGIGQTVFKEKANGSIVPDKDGNARGSHLIAQPFTADEYFQPRPSFVSYNGAASGASNWGANNYQLRDRVARQLGPIVKYASGSKKGKFVGEDIEAWFAKDQYQGQAGIVAQWAQAHSGLASAWVKADKLNTKYVAAWQKDHPVEVAAWIKENPATPEPKPEDVAVPFFVSWSKANPGMFPGKPQTAEGKTEDRIAPLQTGADIQSTFFDMWRAEHPHAELEAVPADMVTASGSGLDPHITLKNGLYQLERVAAAWAKQTKRDEADLRKEIEQILQEKAESPLGGLAGVKLVNVLEVNLALDARYGSSRSGSK